MLGSALYYPHIDISDPQWLRSAILFWDEIKTIVPSGIQQPYKHKDSDICHEEGFLQPILCDLHRDAIDEIGHHIIRSSTDWQEFIRFRSMAPSGSQAARSLGAAHIYHEDAQKFLQDYSINSGKMSPELVDLALSIGLARMEKGRALPELGSICRKLDFGHQSIKDLSNEIANFVAIVDRCEPNESQWMLADSRFATAYMSALAAKLSRQLRLAPLTRSEPSHGFSFRFLFDDLADNSLHNAKGTLVSVVMRGLRVDASVSVEKLIRFRRSRRDQYLDLSESLTKLSETLTNFVPEPGTIADYSLHDKASILYQREVQPKLRALKRELDNHSIQTAWEGAYRALTISVPSAGALAYFTGFTGASLLGAGAALAITDIGVRSVLARRSVRASSPFSYLHDVTESFGLPPFTED